MTRLYAQGDLLIEHVGDVPISGRIVTAGVEGAIVAAGEKTGHRHRLLGPATVFHDQAFARAVPAGLYVAHVLVMGDQALLVHNEHAPIALTRGTYRIRRQRQLSPAERDETDAAELIED